MIKIIGTKDIEKGFTFERFIKKLLSSLGYHNLRTVRKTGRQIDILGNNKVTDQPIICECKAHKEKLEGQHLSEFRGKFDTELDKNKNSIGLFFSLSGFGDGLLEYYNEFSEETKNKIKLYSFEDIYEFVKHSKLILSPDTITHLINLKIPHEIKNLSLYVTPSNEYWISTFGIDSKESHFTVLSNQGNEVQKYEIEEIQLLDNNLKKLSPINLNVRSKLILFLCENLSQTIEQISHAIKESKLDITLALNQLLKEKIVEINKSNYSICIELEPFIFLSKEFLLSENRKSFFRSKYIQNMINEKFINYVQTRFSVNFESTEIEALIKLFKISPSALYFSLTESTKRYETSKKQLKIFENDENKVSKIKRFITTGLFQLFVNELLKDLNTMDKTEILTDQSIKGYSFNLDIRIGSLDILYLKLKSQSNIMMFKAGEALEEGSLVTSTNPIGHIFDSARFFTTIEYYEIAIEDYNEIVNTADDNVKKLALNNLGLIYSKLKDHNKGIECYNKALKIDKNLKESHFNKGIALIEVGKIKEGKSSIKMALKIAPDYQAAKDFLNEIETSPNKQASARL
jgi:tetratricopeptide (TPR) repeat protein